MNWCVPVPRQLSFQVCGLGSVALDSVLISPMFVNHAKHDNNLLIFFSNWTNPVPHSLFDRFCYFPGRWPPQTRGVNGQRGAAVLCTFNVFFDEFWGDTNHVLSLPVFDHVEWLQGADDVCLCNTGHLTETNKRNKISNRINRDLSDIVGTKQTICTYK